jgi:transcriptional regulator with XRE-family HTH domain
MSWRRRPRPPLVKRLRRSLGRSQLQFSARYRIDVRQLRAWERRLAEPTHAELAYIKIVAGFSPKSWHPNWHRTGRDTQVKLDRRTSVELAEMQKNRTGGYWVGRGKTYLSGLANRRLQPLGHVSV